MKAFTRLYSTINSCAIKPLHNFFLSTKEGVSRGKRLFYDEEFRREKFKNILSDVRLNCAAGGLIFSVGDVFAQMREINHTRTGKASSSDSKLDRFIMEMSKDDFNFLRNN